MTRRAGDLADGRSGRPLTTSRYDAHYIASRYIDIRYIMSRE